MFKNYVMQYPLWFLVIWGCSVALFLYLIITGFNTSLFYGGMIALQAANAARMWRSDRRMALVFLIIAVFFSFLLFKYLML